MARAVRHRSLRPGRSTRTSWPIVEDLTWYLDEPFGDTSAIPTYMVSKLAAAHVKVVLTGDGGDEVFAGYDRYLVEDRERSFDTLPRPLRRAAGAVGALLPDGTRGKRFLAAPRTRWARALRRRVDDVPRRRAAAAAPRRTRTADGGHDPVGRRAAQLLDTGDDWLSAVQHWDLDAYLPQDILTKVDRMTMAHSIEARPPLIDHRIVEFAATVPARFRLHDGQTKYLFKQAMRGVLPDHIIDRPKHGFAVPLAQWLRKDLATFARDILLSPTARRRGVFNLPHVERLLQLNDRGRNLDLQLWTILSLELWCRRFLDRAVARARRCAGEVDATHHGRRACDVQESARRHRRREPRHPGRPGRAGAQPASIRSRADGQPVDVSADQSAFPRPLGGLGEWRGVRTLVNQSLYLPEPPSGSPTSTSRMSSPRRTRRSCWRRCRRWRPRAHWTSTSSCTTTAAKPTIISRNWGALRASMAAAGAHIVVPSEYLREVFARHGHDARVIPNVVDLSRFVYRERRPLRPRLLSTRNLEPHYRIDVIVRGVRAAQAAACRTRR